MNTTIGWIYNSSTCVPAVFTLEGYDLEDIIEDELDTPGLALNSTSNRVRLPSRSLIDMFNGSSSVYIRLGAYDEFERTCTQDSEIMFYQLNNGELSYTTANPIDNFFMLTDSQISVLLYYFKFYSRWYLWPMQCSKGWGQFQFHKTTSVDL